MPYCFVVENRKEEYDFAGEKKKQLKHRGFLNEMFERQAEKLMEVVGLLHFFVHCAL